MYVYLQFYTRVMEKILTNWWRILDIYSLKNTLQTFLVSLFPISCFNPNWYPLSSQGGHNYMFWVITTLSTFKADLSDSLVKQSSIIISELKWLNWGKEIWILSHKPRRFQRHVNLSILDHFLKLGGITLWSCLSRDPSDSLPELGLCCHY